jgi:hypothetical protein
MGLLLKLCYKRSDPEGSRRAEITTRRSLRRPAPGPQSLVERHWTPNSTLNVYMPPPFTPPEQRRAPPPSYVIVEPQDRLPRHPEPGSICKNSSRRPHMSNGGPRDHDPRGVHPSSLSMRCSSASPLVAQAQQDAHADANIRRHQSTSVLHPAARRTAPDPAQVNANRLHRLPPHPLHPPPPLCRHLDTIRHRQSTTAQNRPYQPPYQTPPRYNDQAFPARPGTLRWQRPHEAEGYERRLKTGLDQRVLREPWSMPLPEIQEISERQRWEAHIRRDCKYCRKRREGVGSVKRWLGR